MIPKLGGLRPEYERPIQIFPRARDAFRAFLSATASTPRRKVLLPAYIGWSPREGSGVYDPIVELGLTASFYRVDRSLHLDLGHLEEQLSSGPAIVVLIHYFGHVDPSYVDAITLCRTYGALIVEDAAHALFTDLIAGRCGRLGDACLYSLHKVLPTPTGGALVLNPSSQISVPFRDSPSEFPWRYDLFALAAARRRNADYLVTLLQPLAGKVDALWPPSSLDVLQTLPVVIRRGSRDRLYEQLNAAGFGVVSLYHTMIDAIPRADFPNSFELAASIMNLPVHQDASFDQLELMIEELAKRVS